MIRDYLIKIDKDLMAKTINGMMDIELAAAVVKP